MTIMILEAAFCAAIATNIGLININGFNLKIDEMTSNELVITGKIENIDIESKA